jgi:hypothetical protein
MNKKFYNKPELMVVMIPYQNALLAGSNPEREPSEDGGGGKTARQASFSTFDEE